MTFKHLTEQHIFSITLKKSIFIITLLGFMSSLWADESISVTEINLPKLQHPTEHIYTSGQPSESAFTELAKAGVEVIVNLRPDTELNWNEQEKVESLGLSYIHLPVAGAAGVTIDNANKLDAILNAQEGKTILLHCASGNRVGALKALSTYQQNGQDIDAAIETGKNWGLTGLESLVRKKLSQ